MCAFISVVPFEQRLSNTLEFSLYYARNRFARNHVSDQDVILASVPVKNVVLM